MILPRSWVRQSKPTREFSERITEAFQASYRPSAVKVMGIFERQSNAQRAVSARKAVGSRMGTLFAEKLFRKDSI